MKFTKALLATLYATSLVACFDKSESTDPIVIGNVPCGPEHAVAFSALSQSSDYSAIIKQSNYVEDNDFLLVKDDQIKASGLLYNVQSDYVTSAFNRDLYLIGRDDISTIQKYDSSSILIDSGLYQTENGLGYALRDAGDSEGANPYGVGFINETYAIIPRRNKNKAWLVNLGAQQESDFKICELDLSAYETTQVIDAGTPDEVTNTYPPHMFNVSVNGQYAAIAMQRLQRYTPVESSYIAIFDLNTWQEVDTKPNEDGLKGIELKLKNPQGTTQIGNDIYLSSIIYNAGSGCGSGGIEKVDLSTLTTQIVDDSTCYNDVAGTSTGQLYAIENHSASYGEPTGHNLYEINTDTYEKQLVTGFGNTSINSIDAYSQDLWYSQDSVVGRIDINTNSKVGNEISLEQPSRGISFINY